jgi:hypothetical protein
VSVDLAAKLHESLTNQGHSRSGPSSTAEPAAPGVN